MVILLYFGMWPETNGFLCSNRPGGWDKVNSKLIKEANKEVELSRVIAALVLESSTSLIGT